MKKVLILCTGNSCRSIMAEALVNAYLKDIQAYSAGSAPSGKVNQNAKKVLQEEGIWDDKYRSKTIEEAEKFAPFDLVVTVCDNAKEKCVTYLKGQKTIHVGFEDPDGKEYEEFVKTKEEIKKRLLSIIEKELS
ncbi:MAG: arsenate reductase ArsC [Epsilonproteobacteria bacterium]|nr:arsenate reductase ArsC [Campylobacterota bacterium]